MDMNKNEFNGWGARSWNNSFLPLPLPAPLPNHLMIVHWVCFFFSISNLWVSQFLNNLTNTVFFIIVILVVWFAFGHILSEIPYFSQWSKFPVNGKSGGSNRKWSGIPTKRGGEAWRSHQGGWERALGQGNLKICWDNPVKPSGN